MPLAVMVLAVPGLLTPAEPDMVSVPDTLKLSAIVTPPEVLAKFRLLKVIPPEVRVCTATPLSFTVPALTVPELVKFPPTLAVPLAPSKVPDVFVNVPVAVRVKVERLKVLPELIVSAFKVKAEPSATVLEVPATVTVPVAKVPAV